MGRWDDRFSGFGGGRGGAGRIPRKWNRIAKFAIRIGFVIVAIVFLSVGSLWNTYPHLFSVL